MAGAPTTSSDYWRDRLKAVKPWVVDNDFYGEFRICYFCHGPTNGHTDDCVWWNANDPLFHPK